MKLWTLLAIALLGPASWAQGWQGELVRFAPQRDFGPFVYQGADGHLHGLSVELVEKLQTRLALQMLTLPAASQAEQLQALKERRADLISSLRPTVERGQFLLFTHPYARVPAVLVARRGSTVRSLASLRGQTVAVGQGYAVEAVVRARHPQLRWHPVSDDGVALRGVLDGQFAAAVLDRASFQFIERELGLQGLHELAQVDFEYALCLAVRSDWPELRDALDRAIQTLPQAERQALLARWMPPPNEAPPTRTPWATMIGGVLLFSGLSYGLWLALNSRGEVQS